jgi:cell division protein FtsQ
VLDVDRVALDGVPVEYRAEARRAVDVTRGEALLLVDTGAVEARLEALPWVEDAEVWRDLPGTLRATVVPRVTVAWARTAAGRVQLVGRTGVVFGEATEPPVGHPELPVVSPVAARVAAALPDGLRERVSAVVVDDPAGSGIRLRLVDGPEVRMGEPRELRAKAAAAAAVIAAHGGSPATYVDVQVPAAPAVG